MKFQTTLTLVVICSLLLVGGGIYAIAAHNWMPLAGVFFSELIFWLLVGHWSGWRLRSNHGWFYAKS